MFAHDFRRGLKLFEPDRLSGRLLRGLGTSFGTGIVAAVVAFASSLVMARTLGSAHFGVFTYVSSWLNIAVLAATLGLDAALVRFLPQFAADGDWAALRGLLRFSRCAALGVSMVVAAMLAVIGAGLTESTHSTVGPTLCAAAVSLPLLALVAVNQGALQGLHRVGYSQTPRAILRPLLLTAGVAALWQLQGAVVSAPVAMALNVPALVAALLAGTRWLGAACPAAARSIAPRFDCRNWLLTALPMLLVSGMVVLLHETSVVVTAIVGGTTLAGVYAVATRLSRMLAFGMTAGNAIASPLIAELHALGDQRRLQLVSSAASAVSLAVALVLWLALALGGRHVFAAFGDDFRPGQGVVLILAIGQLVNALTGPVAGLLNMTGHHNQYARITLTITTLNLIGNVPGVMLWGIHGAAAVTSTLIVVQNIWAWAEVRRCLGIDSTPLGFVRARRMMIAPQGTCTSGPDAGRRRAA